MKDLNKKKLRNSIIYGIPDELRGNIWKLLCKTKEIGKNHSPELYHRLISLKNEEDDFCIGKDLPRTLTYIKNCNKNPEEARIKLYNVLKAYSSYDLEIGYCQGINYLAAMLLTHIKDE